ncbi:MAG: hypothetical protein KKC11_02885 [Candidatus Omnitrophica bacterium]|nr:hypothetical protein [Candidatus Omnitrophota bacterium]MBU1133707.1 hypothetical protein [Candidatus Omnitrophota bacterium]MBU1810187.1 hypothetical protein [Candidatus Omnitrophota bacterium]MBU2504398.1 hypothetical protein [Candidatus Omnitrophota bacterium]
MTKAATTRERLSIDVLPEEHRQIKVYAALHGETIREYVVESVRERLHQEAEERELSALTMHLDQDPILKKLWDNKKDAAYDKI